MQRKIYICIALFLFISCVATILVFAHGGKTDANGGHYDRSTGEYHYHHGYPAHQHTNGVCPYDYDDKTNHSSGGSSSNGGYSSSGKSEHTTPKETQKESESLSWEEWKEQHWKRADTTDETTKDDDNGLAKILVNVKRGVLSFAIVMIGTCIYVFVFVKK